ncbi:gliding motility lipoprotein GldB [Bacteroidia bacterium]|nr:gliding motility lipoprotein GldB [Bacteroidia bacterium]
MKQSVRIFVLILSCIFSVGCSGKKAYGEEIPDFKIIRIDTELFNYLSKNEPDHVLKADTGFLNVLGGKVIYIGRTDSTGFYERLKKYFSEPTLMGLYRSEQEQFTDIQTLTDEVAYGLGAFLKEFPNIKRPKVCMHVSGLNQSVIVTDEILSLSADKYLGADYPLYRKFFYDYQRQLMTPDRMAPDYLLGFMMANLPFKGKDDVLLDRMLYEGKLRYILSQLLPDRQVWEYAGYTEAQYSWCSANQKRIWKTILENQHLFTGNYMTTDQYLKEAPHTSFLPVESPGRVGIWLGYQIITSYMKQNPDTGFQELIELTDYQDLLKRSKYKP